MGSPSDRQLAEQALAYAARVGVTEASRRLGVTDRTLRRWREDPPDAISGPSRSSLMEALPAARAETTAGYAEGVQDAVMRMWDVLVELQALYGDDVSESDAYRALQSGAEARARVAEQTQERGRAEGE